MTRERRPRAGLEANPGAAAPPGPEAILASAFAHQVERWLSTGTADLAERAAVSAAAEAVVLATAAGHVCLDLAEIDGFDPPALRRALLASGIVAESAARPPRGRADREGSNGPVGAPASTGRDPKPLVLDEAGRLYLHRYHDYECRLARRLLTAIEAPPDDPGAAARARLAGLFADNAARMAGRVDWQRIAAAQALRSRLTIISGGPGTGKTTTVVNLLACLLEQAPTLRIALAAPTGKAAARMIEAIRTRAADLPDPLRERMPHGATTIHRLLGAGLRPGRFRHDAGHPLALDVLVVDEASMLDLALATRLLEAVPAEARIVLLGDKDQLAAVEAGAVFAEIGVASAPTPGTCAALARLADVDPQQLAPPPGAGQAPPASARAALHDRVIWLVDSWRFGGESAIGRLAAEINSGRQEAALQRLRDACRTGQPSQATQASQPSQPSQPSQANQANPADHPGQSATRAPLRWLDPVRSGVAAGEQGRDAGAAALSADSATTDADEAPFLAAVDGYRDLLDEVTRQARSSAPDRLALLSTFERFRVLCAVHTGPRGVQAFNDRLTEAARRRVALDGLADDGVWFEGRPVVMQANDYAVGLFNGDIGLALSDDQGRLKVWFVDAGKAPRPIDPVRLPRHRTAYAMTVHQAQGSEFDEVLVVLPLRPSRVLSREWLYTAVTRSRHAVTLAGPASRIAEAIDAPTRRHSGLLARLDALGRTGG